MKIAYYPGCSLDATAVEYGMSTERTTELLGIDLWEIPDWSCCGASSAHQTSHLLALALPARNLAIAEKAGLDVLAPCAACYNRMRQVEHEVRDSDEIRGKVEKAIDMPYKASQSTVSILELFTQRYGLNNVSAKVKNPLKGMKPACYYGCLLVRPVAITGFDDPENPQSMDDIMKAVGASPVDWAFKTECCGAGLSVTKPNVGLNMIYRVLKNAVENGADSIVTACPICMLNLDMRQKAIEKKFKVNFNIPIYYVTELMAVALGDKPEKAGINKHFVEAVSIFSKLPEKAKAMEAEAAAKGGKAPKAKDDEDSDEGAKPAKKAPVEKKVDAAPAKEDLPGQSGCYGKDNVQLMFALKIYEDEDKAMKLADILILDEARMTKLNEILEQDKAKAVKVADALLAKAAKNSGGEEGDKA
ncbi:MAG: CoB--CoM heterodisulfide reductase iron-sulfur subunit B family protein [Acidobacteriota bacterium]